MSHRDAVRARQKGGRKGLAGHKVETHGVIGAELRAGIAKMLEQGSSELDLRAALEELERAGAVLQASTVLDEAEHLHAGSTLSSAIAQTLSDHEAPCLLTTGLTADLDLDELTVAVKKITADYGMSRPAYLKASAKSGQSLIYQSVQELVKTQWEVLRRAHQQELPVGEFHTAAKKHQDHPMLMSSRQYRLVNMGARGWNIRVQARMEKQNQERERYWQEQYLSMLRLCYIGTVSGEYHTASIAAPKAAESVMPRGNDPAALTELVLKSSHWLLASEVSAQAALSNKNPSSTPNKWKRNNTIFAIPYQGRDRYPGYALGDDGKPLPIMKEILQVFSGKKVPLKIGLWFCSVNSWLGGVAPQDVIEARPQDVLKAAIQEVTPIEHG